MNIIEARELLGVSEYAELDEINEAHDRNIEQAFASGDLALYRRSTRALAELLVESKRFTRSKANEFITAQDEYITSISAPLNQSLTAIRQTEERMRQEQLLAIEDIDNMHRAEERRDQLGEEIAQVDAEVASARAALVASETDRIERRNARRQKLRRLFSFKPRK